MYHKCYTYKVNHTTDLIENGEGKPSHIAGFYITSKLVQQLINQMIGTYTTKTLFACWSQEIKKTLIEHVYTFFVVLYLACQNGSL